MPDLDLSAATTAMSMSTDTLTDPSQAIDAAALDSYDDLAAAHNEKQMAAEKGPSLEHGAQATPQP